LASIPSLSIRASFALSFSLRSQQISQNGPSRTTTSAERSKWNFGKGYNGQQSGDPAKLAKALITISGQEKPPRRFIAGADAVGTAEQVAATLRQQTDAYRKLSSSLAYDDAA
jgi:hypothetical protein